MCPGTALYFTDDSLLDIWLSVEICDIIPSTSTCEHMLATFLFQQLFLKGLPQTCQILCLVMAVSKTDVDHTLKMLEIYGEDKSQVITIRDNM